MTRSLLPAALSPLLLLAALLLPLAALAALSTPALAALAALLLPAALSPWHQALALGVVVVAGALFGAFGAITMLRRAERGAGPIDVPDERRLHTTPTPRGGGLGMFLGGLLIVPTAMMFAASDAEQALVAVVALGWAFPNGLLGWVDDHRPIPIRFKLLLQMGLAAIAVALGLRLDELAVPPFGAVSLGWLAWPISILWLTWVTNLFNFMDGMDALAAGSAAVFFTAFTMLALGGGALGVALFAIGCAGTSLGFLRYNWPPARIFMGDAGSLFSGAALGGLALAVVQRDVSGVPIVVPLILMTTFVFDATFTIARNVARGVPNPWAPHRTHLYQRLIAAGWPQHAVRRLYIVYAVAFAAIALCLEILSAPLQAAALGVVLGACTALLIAVRTAERIHALADESAPE